MTRPTFRRRGANAVEFALLLPVFVILLGGTMELSWLFFQQGAVRTAVTRGCRVAAMQDPGWRELDMATVTTAAQTQVLDRYKSAAGPCTDCSAWASAVGTIPTRSIRCSLRVPYTGLTQLLGRSMDGTITDSVTVRLEYQRRLTQ